MELYELLEPVEDGKDFIVTPQFKKTFQDLNECIGTGFRESPNFIIEIVGTSAIGKTSLKNMIVNCLYNLKKINVLGNNRIIGECPDELKEKQNNASGQTNFRYFSNYRGNELEAIIIEHNFYFEPDPSNLQKKFEDHRDKLENKKYLYLFFDEFEYYFLHRERLKKEGKIKSKSHLDNELEKSLKILTKNNKLNIIIFIFTPVPFLVPSTPIYNQKEIKERFNFEDNYELDIGDNFVLFIFELSLKGVPQYIKTRLKKTLEKSQDEVSTKIFYQANDKNLINYSKKEIKMEQFLKYYKDLINAVLNELVPIYYLKYLLYFIISVNLSDDEIRRIQGNQEERDKFFSKFRKSRNRMHFKYLFAQIVNKIVLTHKNELKNNKLWNFFKKINKKEGVVQNVSQKGEKYLSKLEAKSVVIKI